jgi:hypothetical protein
MRNRTIGLTAAAILVLALAGCAGPMGEVAGDVVGGTAWAGVKGSKLLVKGGKFAAKTTGRTVVGAAKGVHEEFSEKPQYQTSAQPAQSQPARVAANSQREDATLPY